MPSRGTAWIDRRKFIVSAGIITSGFGLFGCEASHFPIHGANMKTAGFGWEISNLHNNGANVMIPINSNMLLRFVDIDVSYMLLNLPTAPGCIEVLCRGVIARSAPTFDDSQGHSYILEPASADFGAVEPHNPNSLALNFDASVAQDWFVSIILKSFAPQDGSASSSQRHVTVRPEATVNSGDYLVFHMDHAGVQCDGEMQVVMGYDLI